LVVGNHDVGFHYDMIDRKLERFNRSFSTRYISLYESKKRNDVYFVSVNSMAMENDGCKFCQQTQNELKKLNKTLECLKRGDSQCVSSSGINFENRVYSRPIVFTHFPLFRNSDSECPKDVDSEFSNIGRNPTFKSKFDCLSPQSTKQV
jgi:hypothetical protein